MTIVGYTNSNQFVDFLKEATITCTLDELDDIINFLKNVKVEHSKYKDVICCSHFRDHNKKWDSTSSDLIVLNTPK